MSVFRNFDNRKAGGVLQNAHPQVHPFAWQPIQRNVRSNPNIPSQPQRIQPHERGTFYPTSASGGGTLAPSMSSGCAGCNGCAGNGPQTNGMTPPDVPMPSAAELSTGHAFPSSSMVRGTMSVTPIRPRPRITGGVRVASRISKSQGGARPMMMPFFGGRGTK